MARGVLAAEDARCGEVRAAEDGRSEAEGGGESIDGGRPGHSLARRPNGDGLAYLSRSGSDRVPGHRSHEDEHEHEHEHEEEHDDGYLIP